MTDLERMAREVGICMDLWSMGAGSVAFSGTQEASVAGVCRDDLEHLSALIRADERKKAAPLREWAKLAFRVINNVSEPLARLAEYSESTEESELTAALSAMAENVALQYPAILGVNYIDAIKDARESIRAGSE